MTTNDSVLKRFIKRLQFAFVLTIDSSATQKISMVVFGLMLFLHLLIFPSEVIGGEIGIESFKNISIKILLLSIVFASFEAVLVNLWVYLMRNKKHCKTAPASGGFLIGFISPLLCCTPLLPAILSVVALVFPSALTGQGIEIQYFVNVYQIHLMGLALCLLILAIVQNVKSLEE
ncbi:hypothetical protein [Marinicellulosiphila megalodicopiae]|uniref:hypothetical protein n=1 Tax=Marinicellulosiphila megalodicopiae TaxID=2724896 RepID=UPI003BB0596B